MKQVLLISIFLIFSNFLFGQFVDTLRYTRGGPFSSASMNNVRHGQTTVKEKPKGETLEIHRSTFKRNLQYSYYFRDENAKPTTLRLKEGFMEDGNFFSLSDSFTTGVDSIFKQYPKTGKPPYLNKVIELFDKRGTARITNYYDNGHIQSIINYIADTSDFDIFAVGIIENGDTLGLKDDYYKSEFVKDYKNRKNVVAIFDTSYVFRGFFHGEERHYHKNGNLSYLGYAKYNYPDSVCRVYYENGQLGLEQYYDKGQQSGKVTAWHENGKLKGYNYYDKDKPIGIWQEWDKNGQLIKEVTFNNYKSRLKRYYNQLITVQKVKEWYSNGQLHKKIKNIDNTNLGSYVEYYENGQLKEKGKYANPITVMTYAIFWLNRPKYLRDLDRDIRKGLKNGKWKYYDKNGNLLVEQKWKFGQLKKEKKYADELVIFDYFNPPAEEHCRSQLNVRVGINDTEYEEKVYCINRREMAWTDTFYNYVVNDLGDSTRYIFEIVEFFDKRGKMNYQRFYPNGQVMAYYDYVASEYNNSFDEPLKDNWRRSGHNEIAGQSVFWYANGNKKWERDIGDYHYGNYKKETQYYENGQKKIETYGYNEEGVEWKKWYENGQLKEQISYDEGDKDGAYLKWNEKGILLKKLNYKEDELDGEQFYYNEKGELIETEIYKSGILVEILLNNK